MYAPYTPDDLDVGYSSPVLATLIAHSPIATIVIAGDLMFLSRAVWCHVLNIDMTDDPTYATL